METGKKETTDLAMAGPAEIQVAPSPLMGIIAAASTDGNVDADKLMKLLEANERYEANEARKAYHIAMATFKEDPPEITKDRTVSYPTKTGGTTTFNHATLANVTSTIGKALSVQGLTASWVTAHTEKGAVEVTCKITHILGHSESCRLQSAPDASGGKNSIQAIGSAVTYLQRYTLLALTGLATYENENDGNGAGNGDKGPPGPSEKEKGYLAKMCDLMVDSVPEGMTLDRKRVQIVTYAKAMAYPYNEEKAISGAKWLIDNLDKNNSWETVCQKAS